MTEYSDEDRGVMFPQTPKSEKGPTSTGKAEVVCRSCGHVNKVRLAGWKRTAKQSGKTFLSISISDPLQESAAKQDAQKDMRDDEFNDEIPF